MDVQRPQIEGMAQYMGVFCITENKINLPKKIVFICCLRNNKKNNKRNNKRRTCREERVVDVKHGANSSSFPCWGRYASRLHFNSSYPTTPSPPFGAISPTGIVPSHIPIPSTPPTPSPVMYVSTNDPVHPPPAVQPQEDKRRNREPIHLTPLMEQVAQRLIDTKLVTTRIL